ncbi:hypothetical protein IC580_08490 [Cupriavidus sp. ISTL7]|nr:hypothetical protein IC580_08490 [Cupriavidus sp. ISTL7]
MPVAGADFDVPREQAPRPDFDATVSFDGEQLRFNDVCPFADFHRDAVATENDLSLGVLNAPSDTRSRQLHRIAAGAIHPGLDDGVRYTAIFVELDHIVVAVDLDDDIAQAGTPHSNGVSIADECDFYVIKDGVVRMLNAVALSVVLEVNAGHAWAWS